MNCFLSYRFLGEVQICSFIPHFPKPSATPDWVALAHLGGIFKSIRARPSKQRCVGGQRDTVVYHQHEHFRCTLLSDDSKSLTEEQDHLQTMNVGVQWEVNSALPR